MTRTRNLTATRQELASYAVSPLSPIRLIHSIIEETNVSGADTASTVSTWNTTHLHEQAEQWPTPTAQRAAPRQHVSFDAVKDVACDHRHNATTSQITGPAFNPFESEFGFDRKDDKMNMTRRKSRALSTDQHRFDFEGTSDVFGSRASSEYEEDLPLEELHFGQGQRRLSQASSGLEYPQQDRESWARELEHQRTKDRLNGVQTPEPSNGSNWPLGPQRRLDQYGNASRQELHAAYPDDKYGPLGPKIDEEPRDYEEEVQEGDRAHEPEGPRADGAREAGGAVIDVESQAVGKRVARDWQWLGNKWTLFSRAVWKRMEAWGEKHPIAKHALLVGWIVVYMFFFAFFMLIIASGVLSPKPPSDSPGWDQDPHAAEAFDR